MSRRICIVTGSRAEYGLLRPVIDAVLAHEALDLQLVVTGMHLSSEFGSTWRDIERDGLAIDARVEMLLGSDTAVGVTKSVGLGTIGFADAFATLKPDIVVVLGDRFEILAAVIASLIAGIPAAHVHGGEVTEGAVDDSIRHAITKMACLHFVAAEAYRNRVVQMGEVPERVFDVGGLGVDAIARVGLIGRDELARDLGVVLDGRVLVVTFHPVTLEPGSEGGQLRELFAALDECAADATIVFTMPNADAGGRGLMEMIECFAGERARVHVFGTLGQRRYLSLVALAEGVVGNSSSGLLEAPSLGVGAINIGSRQTGRLKADSVIDCAPTRADIGRALTQLASPEFRASLAGVVNPYGKPGAGQAIVDTLARVDLAGLITKPFHDLHAAAGI